MALEKYLSTQSSILVAGGLIAAGLFFGLRGREPAPPPPLTPLSAAPLGLTTAAPGLATVTATATVESPVALAPPPASALPPAAAPDQKTLAAAATKELDRHRPDILEKCLQPSVAKSANPPRVKYTFNFLFDATGKQVGRGIVEDRAMSRPDVGVCLASALPPLQIPPPGAVVSVEVDWILP